MMNRMRAAFRLPTATTARTGVRPHARSQRRSARRALACGLIAFIAGNLVLARVLAVSHPEWQEPEFGYRLAQLRQWREAAPARPLVLVVGTSRMQQGIHPAAMGFGSEPTAPLVYNFGYRGSTPLVSTLNVCRVLDAGIKPDFVVAEFSPPSVVLEHGGVTALKVWPNRFTTGDVLWMATHGFIDPDRPGAAFALARWAGTAALPWTSHRQVLQPHLLPNWVTPAQRFARAQERMDEFGFTSMQASTTTREFFSHHREAAQSSATVLALKRQVAASATRAYGALIERCRAEGIPVALIWAPASPFVSRWLSPEGQQACEDYAAALARDGVPVFLPPDFLTDESFADGHHLLPGAAARYSRWLADTHLRPWLKSQGARP